MITEERKIEKMCALCVSDYHLEMILLPYIKSRLNSSNFIVFTENNLEETLNVLLTKINLDKDIIKRIKDIGWKNENSVEKLERYLSEDKEINVIINGDIKYIEETNNYIRRISKKINIIDCYHICDINVDISEIKEKYNCVLNTQKI